MVNMTGISDITGKKTYDHFSDYGGYGGANGTTSGVGGVGAYHHHHRRLATKAREHTEIEPPATNQTSDLLNLLGAAGQTGQSVPNDSSATGDSSAKGIRPDALTANDRSRPLAVSDAQIHSPTGSGAKIDTLA